MSKFSILIPHDPPGWHDRNAEWNAARWRAHLPEAEVLVGGVGANPANRSANRNLLAQQATTDLLLFIDADCTAAVRHLVEAAELAADTGRLVKFRRAGWVSEQETARLLQTDPAAALGFRDGGVTLRRGLLMGFAYLLRRDAFETVGRWDERFTGWGEEDPAFTLAAETLLGPVERHPEPMYHLHHPCGGTHNKQLPTFQANRRLLQRYEAVRGDREAMRQLTREWRQ